jgi:hypothetical protein
MIMITIVVVIYCCAGDESSHAESSRQVQKASLSPLQ